MLRGFPEPQCLQGAHHGVDVGTAKAIGPPSSEHAQATAGATVDLQHPGPKVSVQGEINPQLKCDAVAGPQQRTHPEHLVVHIVEGPCWKDILGR